MSKPIYTILPGQCLSTLRELSVNSLYFIQEDFEDWAFAMFEPLQEENRKKGFIYNFRLLHKLDPNGQIPYLCYRRGELRPQYVRHIYMKISSTVY